MCGVSGAWLSAEDTLLFQEVFPYSLKSPHPDHRQRMMRFMKPLIARLKECVRVNQRVLAKARPDADAGAIADSKRYIEEASGLATSLVTTLHSNIYPNAPFAREVLTLELLHVLVDNLAAEPPGTYGRFHEVLWSHSTVTSIINLFISSWDRTRSMASELLLKFPTPLPGYDSVEAVEKLCVWGLTMTGSPRQVATAYNQCMHCRDAYSQSLG